MANYTTLVNSTTEIGTHIEEFNATVTSIDDFSTSSYGGNRVAVVIEYTE